MAIKRPGIPAVDLTIEPKTRAILMALKENAEIANGVRSGTNVNESGWQRRSVTLQMLINVGLITEEQARQMYQES